MFTECEQARAFKALVLPKGSRDAKREGKKEGHPKQETLQVLAGALGGLKDLGLRGLGL